MTSYITIYDIIDIDDIDEYDKSELFQVKNEFFKVSVTGDEPRYGNDYKGFLKVSIVPDFGKIGDKINEVSDIIRLFSELNEYDCNMCSVADLTKYEVESFRAEIKSINKLIDKLIAIL